MSQTLTLPSIRLTSLEAYIATINQYPLLSSELEYSLAERYQTLNDLSAAKQLILSHLRLVVSISRHYLGYGLPHADLIQEGNLGLMKAVKKFDPRVGTRLATLATYWIKAEIHEFIVKNYHIVKIATTKAQRKLFFKLRSLKGLKNNLSPQDISQMSDTLKTRPEDVTEMEKRLQSIPASYQESSKESEEDRFIVHSIPDTQHEPSRQLETQDAQYLQETLLPSAIAQLDERARHIVQERWLSSPPKTLQSLAKQFKVSAERIRQIEVQALSKLQSALREHQPELS